MKMKLYYFLIACLLGISATAQTSVADRIIQLNKELETAFNNNEMMKVSSYYLDSSLISGGGMNITGRTSIDQYWMSLKDQHAAWKLETDQVEDYGEIVIQRGKSYLTMTNNGAKKEFNVRFLLIWKKTELGYRILYDVFSRL
jgi:ketosteroid isomerase-like protein